jgi:hypothetical protein
VVALKVAPKLVAQMVLFQHCVLSDICGTPMCSIGRSNSMLECRPSITQMAEPETCGSRLRQLSRCAAICGTGDRPFT